jgi:hypothetical protein
MGPTGAIERMAAEVDRSYLGGPGPETPGY